MSGFAQLLKTAKGADACRQATKELLRSFGGALDPMPVLREFLKNLRLGMQASLTAG